MKHLVRSLALASVVLFLLILASCANDDTVPTMEEEVAEQPTENPEKEESQVEEPEKETEEELAVAEEHGSETSDKIACNVLIKGGERIEGLPPTPNGAITMDLSDASIDAYLNEGFDIPIVSDADVVGAYIQFRAEGEGISTSYYNVNLQENNAFSAKATKMPASRAFKGGSLFGKPTFKNLDVDFSPEIAPGEFCYLISVYDANGDVSDPQEVCVTVNSWGGYDALVGEWHYTKAETYFFDGTTEIRAVETETCSQQSFECSNGSSLEYDFCFTKQSETFMFNSDGTYTHTYGQIGKDIDAVASDVNCEIVLTDTALSYVINGNWSYNPEKEELIIVEYELNYAGSAGPFSEIAEPGSGYLYDLNNVVVDNSSFSWGYPLGTDLNGDGEVNADDGGWANFYERQ